MPPTMHDVADRAGVSIKTVSNVLNGYPHIRESTRAKVLAAIDELGYQLNISARNLRSGRTGVIGLAVPELSLPYFGQLADAVIRAAEKKSWTVLVEQTGGTRERELAVLSGSRQHLIDGLLFSPLAIGPGDVDSLRVDFPLVLLGERVFLGPADHVTMSNFEAARAATRHLLDLGRRRIAVIGTHPGEAMSTAALRLEGYLAALREAGVVPTYELIAPAAQWHRAEGAEAMTRLLDAGASPDAVFCFNDTLALGALHLAHRRGIQVPDDIAIMGFDDIEEAQFSMPTLTSVEPGREQIASTGVAMLAERIAAPDGGGEHRGVLTDFTLKIRESTAGPDATVTEA